VFFGLFQFLQLYLGIPGAYGDGLLIGCTLTPLFMLLISKPQFKSPPCASDDVRKFPPLLVISIHGERAILNLSIFFPLSNPLFSVRMIDSFFPFCLDCLDKVLEIVVRSVCFYRGVFFSSFF